MSITELETLLRKTKEAIEAQNVNTAFENMIRLMESARNCNKKGFEFMVQSIRDIHMIEGIRASMQK